MAADLHLGAADLGFLTSIYFLIFAAVQLPFGALLDRHGPKLIQSGLLLLASNVKPVSWHWFALRGRDASPIFAFPGIWATRVGEKGRPEGRVYAFLTTTPYELVATINHERMPVLLTREEEFEAWLSGAPAEALALAREYPPGQMRIVQEDFKKQDLLAAAA